MLYRLGIWACAVYVHILFRFRTVGLENLPRGERGFILASNHRHNCDPLFVAIKLRQQVCYMAKAELFQKKWRGKLLKRLGAFPVERGKGDTGAIDWAKQVLRSGDVLGMFPEGHRSKDGTLLRPKSGTAMISSQTKADVVPCAVCFGECLKFRTVVTVRYGKPIPYESLGFTENAVTPHEIKAASGLIMSKIEKLLGEGV